MDNVAATESHNAFAGQGPVVLDIGGDVGALIVAMPASLEGVEVEIRPVGAEQDSVVSHDHSHEHAHDHHHARAHDDSHGHEHSDGPGHRSPHPHVAVVARPSAQGLLPSLVFAELVEGDYELYERSDRLVRLQIAIRGGEVTYANWPV
jgi:hypothetical protein